MMEATPEKRAMAIKIMQMICQKKNEPSSIPYHDSDLVDRALKNSFRMAPRGKTKRAAAGAVFGIGSSVSSAICRRFGFDPNEVAR